MTKIANVLITAMGISDDEQRRDFLWEHQVLVIRAKMVHRIAGFDRRPAAWVTFCGILYDGNAHEEEAMEGMTNCMACTVGR